MWFIRVYPPKKTRLLKRRVQNFALAKNHMKLARKPKQFGEIRGLRGLWANWGLSFDLGFAEDGEGLWFHRWRLKLNIAMVSSSGEAGR